MYRYLVFLGNNSELVRGTLQRRPWWRTAIEDEDSRGAVCTVLPAAMFGGPPRMDWGRHKQLAEEGLLSNAFDVCWRPTLGMKLYTGDLATIHSVEPPSAGDGGPGRQLMNHFPSVKCIAAKTGLARHLGDYYARLGLEVFDHVPTTFILRDIGRRGLPEYSRFCAHFRQLGGGDVEGSGERMPAKHCRRNMWLVKPAYLNQGKGIKVYAELTPIKEHLMSVDRDGLSVDGAAVSAGAEWVVQKYCELPLLINGRKFDIRIWVVVDDEFNIYVYQDGYCRTSSELFTLDLGRKPGPRSRDGHDAAQMVHLTNYCMQKHSKNLGAFEEGNTLSFEQLQTFLDAAYRPGFINFRTDLLPRMKELILDSVLANRDRLVEGGKGRRSFELFGYDFLIDCDFRTWLIEVNTNPYIDKQNPWHHRLLLRMMEDLAALVIDPLYPPPGGPPRATHFPPMLPVTSPAAATSAATPHLPTAPVYHLAERTPGFVPLPDDVYTAAFTHHLQWKPTSQRVGGGAGRRGGASGGGAGGGAGVAGGSTEEDEDADGGGKSGDEGGGGEGEGEDDGDEHGLDGNAILAVTATKRSGGGGSGGGARPPRPAAAAATSPTAATALKTSPYSAPVPRPAAAAAAAAAAATKPRTTASATASSAPSTAPSAPTSAAGAAAVPRPAPQRLGAAVLREPRHPGAVHPAPGGDGAGRRECGGGGAGGAAGVGQGDGGRPGGRGRECVCGRAHARRRRG